MNFLRSPAVVSFFLAIIFYVLHITVVSILMKYNVTDEVVPFIEESFKFITLSVSGYCGLFWTAMFGIEEGLTFVSKYQHKVGLYPIYIIRSVALMFHFFLLGIQYYGFRQYRKTKSYMTLVWFFTFAVCAHYLWNRGIGIIFIMYVIEPVMNFFSMSLVRGY